MTKEKQPTRPGMFESRYWKAVLTIFAVVLTFGSPYLVYVMTHALHIGWFSSIGSGGVLFATGLVLIWYLIKKKVIS
jgi:hypothetical protein